MVVCPCLLIKFGFYGCCHPCLFYFKNWSVVAYFVKEKELLLKDREIQRLSAMFNPLGVISKVFF